MYEAEHRLHNGEKCLRLPSMFFKIADQIVAYNFGGFDADTVHPTNTFI